MNKEEKEALLNLLRNNLIKLTKTSNIFLLDECAVNNDNCCSNCPLEKRICMATRTGEISNKILDFLHSENIEELL